MNVYAVPPPVVTSEAFRAATGGVVSTEIMVVGSVAVSFVVSVSPPPETVAVLITLAGALPATLTLTVNAG